MSDETLIANLMPGALLFRCVTRNIKTRTIKINEAMIQYGGSSYECQATVKNLCVLQNAMPLTNHMGLLRWS